jgi:hypothetical protein
MHFLRFGPFRNFFLQRLIAAARSKEAEVVGGVVVGGLCAIRSVA